MNDQPPPQSPVEPAWTVVVPTFDRPESLRRCLRALQRLRPVPGGAVEIVVVDDGGDRPASRVAAAVDGPHAVRVHRQANAGPAAARNTGARLARGDRVAFTDDDCRPDPDWLRGLAAGLDAHPDALVGGQTVNALPGNLWAEATQTLVDHVIATTPGGFLPSCNLGVHRRSFLAAGGFDQGFPRAAGEDRALCDRWRAGGAPVLLVPGAVVGHEHHLSATSFWRQHAAYGRAARRVHTTPGGSRPGPPSRYVALLARPFRTQPGRRAVTLSARLVLSQLATAWGWARAGASSRSPRNPR